MKWNFWRKNTGASIRQSRPKDLESRIGRMLVVDLNYDPDWVWRLKAVTLRRIDSKSVFDFRIFDPVSAQMLGVAIENYTSLDVYPKMIYFDGWYDKATWEIKLNDRHKEHQKEPAA